MNRRSRIMAALVAVIMSLPLGVITPVSALTVDNRCTKATAVFARGSGQGLSSKENETFRKQLTDRIGVSELNFYELGTETYGGSKYEAVNIGDVTNGNAIGAYFSGGTGYDYGKSVNQGVAELHAFLNERHEKCPDEYFILGGYSQGAQVIGQTLPSMTTQVKEKIIFNALFGDPKLYLPEGEGLFPPACDGRNMSVYRREIANCHVDNGVLGARKPYVENYDNSRIGLWCIANDFICGSTKFMWDNEGHGKYGEGNGPIDVSAHEAASRLKAAMADNSTDINDKPTNNSLGTTGTDVVFVLDTTGSMGSYIQQAKLFMERFSSQIKAINGRVGLVVYRDSGDEYTAKKLSDLQTDTAHMLKQLNTVLIGGGNDEPEAGLHASMTAMNTMNWQQGAAKAIILLTDAPFHNPDKVDGTTIDAVVKRSLEIDPVNIYPVVDERWKDSYEEIAAKTSGQVIVNNENSDVTTSLMTALTKIKNRPNAKLKIGAYYSQVGREITFDASDSYVVDGKIVTYEWDFNGDGVIDQTTTSPVAKHVYNEKFDGHMQVRMWADNDTVSNISASVKIGVPSDVPVGPKAPSVTAEVIDKKETKATVLLKWQATDNLSEKWIIRQNDDTLGWVVGGQSQLEVRDVDLSKANTYSVTGVTKDGLIGETGSAVVEATSSTPSPDLGVNSETCPYKFQIGKILFSCRYKKVTFWGLSWRWIVWWFEWVR